MRLLIFSLLVALSHAFHAIWRTSSIAPSTRSLHSKSTPKKPATALNVIDLSTSQAVTDAFSLAFVGGTVGVMSLAVLVEVRRAVVEKNNDENCPYCLGNGEMLCGICFGNRTASGAVCSCCGGRGLVTCLNCKGDGRSTPLLLQSKAVRDPVSSLHYHSSTLCFTYKLHPFDRNSLRIASISTAPK